ncbi:hypothetical protein [Hydrogenophaga luteola]|uniref:Uncharacterized protein n=1 Tax=Hydrogenophaga luteola TaxID=1591122 RepID=A0ABV7W897_9BURK
MYLRVRGDDEGFGVPLFWAAHPRLRDTVDDFESLLPWRIALD